MIEVLHHIVVLHFKSIGLAFPYSGAPQIMFDPNDSPDVYGQASQIALLIVTPSGQFVYMENIPNGSKPYFKRHRRKNGNNPSRTIGFKIGFHIDGMRKYRYINLEDGSTEYKTEKI